MSRRIATSPQGLALCVVLVVASLAFVLPSALADSNWTITDLGDLPGGSSTSDAYGINNAGQVVGDGYVDAGQRGFLWSRGGGMQDIGFFGEAGATGATPRT